MNKHLSRTSASGASTAVQLMFLVWKWSPTNLMVLEKLSVSKLWFFCPHFASRTVYRSLLYVLKVAMGAKRKRFQTTHDICKFYLHLYTDQQQSKFSVSYLAMELQSKISCVHHLFSVIYAFLFLVELVLAERDSKNGVVSFFFCRWDLVCRPPVRSEDRGNWGIRIVATFTVCKWVSWWEYGIFSAMTEMTHVSLAMM